MKLIANRIDTAVTQLTSGFARDTRGAVALMLGLAAVPVILAAGAAVDFFRIEAARAELQVSLDASALAGAAARTGTSEAERRQIALDAFAANFRGGFADDLKGTPDVKFEGGQLTVSYNAGLPSTLLSVGGFSEFNVGASSTVSINLPAHAEIALVLDYSASMDSYSAGQRKYVTMRKAAIDMVNSLTDDGKNPDVRFGLVPFSHNVFATLPSSHVVGARGGSWTGCTYDRQYPYNTAAGTPGGSRKSKWGQDKPTDFGSYRTQASYHCDGYKHNGNGYQANHLQVRELSSNHSAVISQLEAMKPYGYTNISLGVEFGWHLLEPGAPYDARSYSDQENKKFIVVLTDGKQTTPAFGRGRSRDRFDGESNLTKLCSNIKAGNKITVIAIAFALDDNATESRLRNCATDPDQHFFKAENSNDLTSAFEDIRQQIAKAIFLSR